jgi:hypothetical protein
VVIIFLALAIGYASLSKTANHNKWRLAMGVTRVSRESYDVRSCTASGYSTENARSRMTDTAIEKV